MQRIHLAAFLLIASMTWPDLTRAQDTTATLTITVTGVCSDTGKVCLSLYASKDGWPTNNAKAFQRTCVAPRGKMATFSFAGLPQGTYAAFAFHDEDTDGKIKKNFIGMPKEGVGASNDAGGIGGPSFKAASFVLDGTNKTIAFSLKYL